MKHDLEEIPFGFLAGKKFCEVTLAELDRAVGWLEEKKLDKSYRYVDFCKKAAEYLEANHYGADMDHGGKP